MKNEFLCSPAILNDLFFFVFFVADLFCFFFLSFWQKLNTVFKVDRIKHSACSLCPRCQRKINCITVHKAEISRITIFLKSLKLICSRDAFFLNRCKGKIPSKKYEYEQFKWKATTGLIIRVGN